MFSKFVTSSTIFLLLNVVSANECFCKFDTSDSLCKTLSSGFSCSTQTPKTLCPCELIKSVEICNANGGKKTCIGIGESDYSKYCSCKVTSGGNYRCTINPSGEDGECAAGFCECLLIDRDECKGADDYYCYNTVYEPGSAIGDPHFKGFDGSFFDFHGIHSNCYMVFGVTTGDHLVARVRATNELYHGFNKTYFKEFGLQTQPDDHGNSNKVHVFIHESQNGKREMLITVNQKSITSNHKHGSIRITFGTSKKGKNINVKTLENSFDFRAVSMLSAHRHHIDFQVQIGKTRNSNEYNGILGITLSRKLGSKAHEQVIRNKDKVNFEMSMRKRYGTQSLFPNLNYI